MNVEDELAVTVVEAVRGGDVDELRSLLEECPWLATPGSTLDAAERDGAADLAARLRDLGARRAH